MLTHYRLNLAVLRPDTDPLFVSGAICHAEKRISRPYFDEGCGQHYKPDVIDSSMPCTAIKQGQADKGGKGSIAANRLM